MSVEWIGFLMGVLSLLSLFFFVRGMIHLWQIRTLRTQARSYRRVPPRKHRGGKEFPIIELPTSSRDIPAQPKW